MIDHTHDPRLTSWVPDADDDPDFPIQNLPVGIFSTSDAGPRGGVAIGRYILDISALLKAEILSGPIRETLWAASKSTLNDFMALPGSAHREFRQAISKLLTNGSRSRSVVESMLYRADSCTMHLSASVGNYSDFYAGIHHAAAAGKIMRPNGELVPNYKYVPIAYHGRASTVRVSGTPVYRPWGQVIPDGANEPIFCPTARLDYELEVGLWLRGGNMWGERIAIGRAGDAIAGICLLNDWSARDIQRWEGQPLGPFLAKSFATSVSPWVILMDALAPFRTGQPPRPAGDPVILPHLLDRRDQESGAIDMKLEVHLVTSKMKAASTNPVRISDSNMLDLYWTPAQLIAHHTSNGCDLKAGDLVGTGTISGANAGQSGCLLELTRGGELQVALPGGEVRTYLEAGDEVILSGRFEKDGFRSIGAGSVSGIIADQSSHF